MDYLAIERESRDEVQRATSPIDAMTRLVGRLKSSLPYYSWVGIYQVVGNELMLGLYVGKPSPHSRIPLGRGICGAAATEKQTI